MHLTKSQYLSGQNCSKKLWLSSHKPEKGKHVDNFSAKIGNEVGLWATKNYPDGMMIKNSYNDHGLAVKETLKLYEVIK